MAGGQKKLSQLPQDIAPTVTDSIPTYDSETAATKRSLISDLITLFFNNIPAAAATSTTLANDSLFPYINSGGVITGDAYASTRAASMSALTAYINGQKGTVSAVTARVYTASKDTYVDLLNTGGVFTLVYTEVSNNAASPALAANSIRLGIVVTGATTIAAAGSINQGQEDKVLPISSSIPYSVVDSLGNLICPRDPFRKLLGYRQRTTSFTSAATTLRQVTELSVPVIIPLLRKIKITVFSPGHYNTTSGANSAMELWDGVVGSGTVLSYSYGVNNISAAGPGILEYETTPATSSKTYNTGLVASTTGTATLEAGALVAGPMYIKVELA